MIERILEWEHRHGGPILDGIVASVGGGAASIGLFNQIDLAERLIAGALAIILLALRIWAHVKRGER